MDGRNPAPDDRWFIPSLFTWFQPSKVVQDFFHPQFIPIVRFVGEPDSKLTI